MDALTCSPSCVAAACHEEQINELQSAEPHTGIIDYLDRHHT
jgi:hypothetical protein